MRWGLGTGRCGTALLAKNEGGWHEPLPRIVEEGKKYWEGCHTGALLEILSVRKHMETPIIVDHKNSLVIPAILKVDPDATFVWLLRDPVDCVRSCLHIDMYQRDDPWDRNRLEPRDGFPKYYRPIDKVIWRYYTFNQTIEAELSWIERDRWKLAKSEELDNWSPSNPVDFDEVKLVESQLREAYVRWSKHSE